ncbi:MAG: transposase, partial [Aeromonas sp.]
MLTSPYKHTGRVMKKQNHYSAEFKLEAAKLVLDQNYSQPEAATAMNVSLSALNRWVMKLRQER